MVADLLDAEPKGSDCWRAGVLLMAALYVGPNYVKLHNLTHLPTTVVTQCGYYFRQGGIWTGDRPANYMMHYDWLDEIMDGDGQLGVVGFVLQAMVGAGDVVRDPEDGTYRQRMLGDYCDLAADDPAMQVPRSDVVSKANETARLRRLSL